MRTKSCITNLIGENMVMKRESFNLILTVLYSFSDVLGSCIVDWQFVGLLSIVELSTNLKAHKLSSIELTQENWVLATPEE